MEELLGKLGIDWKLFIGQIINFLIFLWIINKFVYKPLLETMRKRADMIEKGVKNASEQEKIISQMEKEKNQVIEKARKEAEEIVSEAVIKAKTARDRVLEETRNDAKIIFEDAKKEIKNERNQMYQELKKDVGVLAINISERVIKESLNAEKHEKLIKEMLKEIE